MKKFYNVGTRLRGWAGMEWRGRPQKVSKIIHRYVLSLSKDYIHTKVKLGFTPLHEIFARHLQIVLCPTPHVA